MSENNNIVAYQNFLYIYNRTGCDAAYRLAMEYFQQIDTWDVLEYMSEKEKR